MSVLLVVLLSGFTFSAQDKTADILGNWQGFLRGQLFELRLGFTIQKKAEGKFSATMFSIDQGNAEVPVDAVEWKNGTLKLTISKAFAQFEGKLAENGQQIEGSFKQGGAKFPLTLKKVDKLETPKRPQEPKPPFPYRTEEVAYENSAAKVKLAGTLTLPPGQGPFPAVLLITGSGPQDRDEAIMGHRPFYVLADFLTRRGIAVLRVDDRGVGKSTGNFNAATTFDFAEDTLAGVRFLQTRREVDGKHIGLIGHSEGGIIAPIVATKTSDVAFIVLLAGTGLPGDEILLQQSRLLALAEGAKEEQLTANAALQSKLLNLVKSETPGKELVAKLKKVMQEGMEQLPADLKAQVAKIGMETTLSQLNRFEYPWFKTFLLHDPRLVLRKVACPVLALNGEKDLQVPCKENLEEIAKALKAGGNTQVTIKAFPHLNHLFQKCQTGSVSEYVKIEETMNPEVLQTIAAWILERK
jgi:pimeloyl-ACP methyl ester carboxylesterase